MAKHINLQAVSTYIATAAPSQLGVLRDICLARAVRLGVTTAKAKPLPLPQAGVKEFTLKVAGLRKWAEEITAEDEEGKANLASVLESLDKKLAW